MNAREWEVRLYLLNAAILFTHEIDSAYWHEWELFGVPGGIPVFAVLNLVLILVFLYGFRELIEGERTGHVFSMALAGLFAVAAHGFFFLSGRPEFTLPVSLALLGATSVVSLVQGYVGVLALGRSSEPMRT